jgi:hypothetical protein
MIEEFSSFSKINSEIQIESCIYSNVKKNIIFSAEAFCINICKIDVDPCKYKEKLLN